MLYDDIKSANIDALKNKDKEARAILSIVYTKCKLLEVELRTSGKEIQESDVLTIIQKVLKELSDEKADYLKVNNTERACSIEIQENVLKRYLPKQLGEDEIKEIISTLEDKSMPSVMKHFKINYAGKVDMSLVSQIARNL